MKKTVLIIIVCLCCMIWKSCTENKGQSLSYLFSGNGTIKETEEVKPPYFFLFDELLCDGFVFPVKMNLSTFISSVNGKSIQWKTEKDSLFKKNNGELFYSNSIAAKNIALVSPAIGIVISIERDTIINCFVLKTEHRFIENAKFCKVEFEIRGLDSVLVKEKDTIRKNDVIARIGKWKYKKGIAFAVKTGRSFPYALPYHISPPVAFIKNYKTIPLPKKEKDLLVSVKHQYKMYHFKNGILFHTYEIALSQDPDGHKQQQGDNKTAEGEYYISEKKKGPFYGDTGPWLGNSWMQFSYPNRFDAWEGYKRGAITLNECNSIVNSDKNKQPTLSYTDLGGRVGLHGWNGDWIADGTQNLTWGCMSMHNEEIDNLYEKISLGTRLLILP